MPRLAPGSSVPASAARRRTRRRKTATVLLVEDSAPLRSVLRHFVERFASATVVGESESGDEAIAAAGSLHPDLAIVDVRLPGMTGVEATRGILERAPKCRVLGMSAYADEHAIGAMLEAGAAGFVLKEDVASELREAIAAVRRGSTYLSTAVRSYTNVEIDVVDNSACAVSEAPAAPRQRRRR